jgi:hypothetical protein
MATLKFEAVASVGKDKNGKTKYQKVGAVFESDKGLSLKLDCLPVGCPEWNGWISLYVPKDKTESRPAQKASTGGGMDTSDDIPFLPMCGRKWYHA